MAGGVALNCVANGRVIRETPMKNLFVQPAAGDAGRRGRGRPLPLQHAREAAARRRPGRTPTSGPAYKDEEIARVPGRRGCHVHGAAATSELLRDDGARSSSEGNVIGWFQGRMEFGPRALGGRSILADPRDPKMRDTLNMKIKFREGFRPFAPSVLADKAAEWFDIDCDSPYMLLVAPGARGQARDPVRHPRGQLGAPADGDPRARARSTTT